MEGGERAGGGAMLPLAVRGPGDSCGRPVQVGPHIWSSRCHTCRQMRPGTIEDSQTVTARGVPSQVSMGLLNERPVLRCRHRPRTVHRLRGTDRGRWVDGRPRRRTQVGPACVMSGRACGNGGSSVGPVLMRHTSACGCSQRAYRRCQPAYSMPRGHAGAASGPNGPRCVPLSCIWRPCCSPCSALLLHTTMHDRSASACRAAARGCRRPRVGCAAVATARVPRTRRVMEGAGAVGCQLR